MGENKLTGDYYDCLASKPPKHNLAVFIPTCNRPMQFEACLNSICTNLFSDEQCHIYVLAKSSTEHIKQCYKDIVAKYSPKRVIVLSHETDFAPNFLNLLEHLDHQYNYVVGFTDDTLAYRPLNFSLQTLIEPFQVHSDLFTISLRLGKNTTQQNVDDPTSKIVIPSKFENGQAIWKWNQGFGDINVYYPISLDGHIYRTNELLDITKSVQFHNLRTWEAETVHHCRWTIGQIFPDKILCYESSYTVNIINNMVQEPFFERIGPYGKSLAEFQKLYDDGYRVDLEETFKNVKIIGSHQYIECKYTRTV